MIVFKSARETLERLELIRCLLGYAVLETDDWTELNPLSGPVLTTRYCRKVIARQHQVGEESGQCTFASKHAARVTFTTHGYVIAVDCTEKTTHLRPTERAIDPTDGVGAAVAILTGYLHEDQPEFDMSLIMADPCAAARPYLVSLLGEEEAARILSSYTPSWRGWRDEAQLARLQAQVRTIRVKRDYWIDVLAARVADSTG